MFDWLMRGPIAARPQKKVCDHVVGIDWGLNGHQIPAMLITANVAEEYKYEKHHTLEYFDFCPRCGERLHQ